MLLGLVVVVAAVFALRQAVYLPQHRRSQLREELADHGLAVTAVAPERSWRNWVFADEDLLDVTAVTVPEGNLPDGVLDRLRLLPRLESLSLIGCDVSDADATALAACRSLRTLDLTNTRIGDAGLAEIADLPLVDLDLSGTRVTAASLPTLGRMTTLRRLGVPRAEVLADPVAAEPLGSLTNLNILIIPDRDEYEAFTDLPPVLGTLPLVRVEWRDNPFMMWSYSQVAASARRYEPATGLHHLPVAIPARPIPLPESPWQRLEIVDLEQSPTAEHWHDLARMSDLKRLDVNEWAGLPTGRPHLPPPPGLRVRDTLVYLPRRLDAAALAGVVNAGAEETYIATSDLALSAEELVATILAAPPGRSLTIRGPWHFPAMPGLERLANDAPFETLELVRSDHQNRVLVRTDGRPGTDVVGDPSDRPDRQIRNAFFLAGTTPAPDWLVTAAVEGDGTFEIDRSGWDTGTRGDLATVTAIPRVSRIVWPCRSFGDADVERLLACRHLRALLIDGPVTDAQFERLLAHPPLEILVVISNALTVKSLDAAQSRQTPRHIALGSSRFPRERLDPEAVPYELDHLAQVFGNPNLTHLPDRFFFDTLLIRLPPLDEPTLRIFLRSPVDVEAALTRRYSDVERASITAAALRDEPRIFAELSNLRHVFILRPAAGDADLDIVVGAELASAAELRSISILAEPTDRPTSRQHDRRPNDLTWLPARGDVARLYLKDVLVTAAGRTAVSRLPNLRRLGIERLADAGRAELHDLTFLTGHDRWEVIRIPDLRVDDAGLARIAQSPNLERLCVDGIGVTDASADVLADLLGRGVDVQLIRPDLSFPVIERLSATDTGSLTVVGAEIQHDGWKEIFSDLPGGP